jgi:hypothetical protein
MNIPNLSTNNIQNNPIPENYNQTTTKNYFSWSILFFLLVIGVVAGFWFSRLMPLNKNSSQSGFSSGGNTASIAESKDDVQVNKLYGNTEKNFKDSATGTVKSGGVNGEGTHTLERDGGISQNATLTSSTLDLDLFVGRKVEIKGETNSSTKAGWFLDVGSIKVLE